MMALIPATRVNRRCAVHLIMGFTSGDMFLQKRSADTLHAPGTSYFSGKHVVIEVQGVVHRALHAIQAGSHVRVQLGRHKWSPAPTVLGSGSRR